MDENARHRMPIFCQEILEHLNDAHGRNSLLATYVHYQACIPPEQHAAVGVPVRPLSMPPQRKLGRRSSQSDVATSPTNATCDAEVCCFKLNN